MCVYLASSVIPLTCALGSLNASQALSSSIRLMTSSNWARANRILRASAATLEQHKDIYDQTKAVLIIKKKFKKSTLTGYKKIKTPHPATWIVVCLLLLSLGAETPTLAPTLMMRQEKS